MNKESHIPVIIQLPPTWIAFDVKPEISLDGKSLGELSMKKGFIIEKNIASGKHTITAAISGFGWVKTKELPFELNKNEPTVLNISYSRMWANFNELEVSSINTRLAKLYEEKWPKLRTAILIGAITIGIIIALYCGYWWNRSSYYTGWQDECIDRWDEPVDYVDCQEHVNEYYNKDFTLNEITWMVDDSWFFWLFYTIFMTTMISRTNLISPTIHPHIQTWYIRINTFTIIGTRRIIVWTIR